MTSAGGEVRADAGRALATLRRISAMRVAAELLEQGVGQDEATIASPTTAAAGTAQTSLRSMAAGDSLHGRQVDRAQRLHQRGDRLHVAGDAEVLAVGDAALEAAGAVGRRATPTVACRRRRPAAGRSRRAPASPGSAATAGPLPMPTALIAWIDISACASRPSSLRSHWT